MGSPMDKWRTPKTSVDGGLKGSGDVLIMLLAKGTETVEARRESYKAILGRDMKLFLKPTDILLSPPCDTNSIWLKRTKAGGWRCTRSGCTE